MTQGWATEMCVVSPGVVTVVHASHQPCKEVRESGEVSSGLGDPPRMGPRPHPFSFALILSANPPCFRQHDYPHFPEGEPTLGIPPTPC